MVAFAMKPPHTLCASSFPFKSDRPRLCSSTCQRQFEEFISEILCSFWNQKSPPCCLLPTEVQTEYVQMCLILSPDIVLRVICFSFCTINHFEAAGARHVNCRFGAKLVICRCEGCFQALQHSLTVASAASGAE